jgi:two-component system OmpR family response regulator
MPRVLVVDDDRDIGRMLQDLFARNGIESDVEFSAAGGRKRLTSTSYDLVVLDVVMPGESGFDLCRSIRTQSRTPILMLTAISDLVDRVVGLEIGADDYLTKPFEGRELVARCRALLRRSQAPTKGDAERSLVGLGFTMSQGRQELRDQKGRLVDLTATEFQVLFALAARPNIIMSREWIAEASGLGLHVARGRSLDVIIGRIRSKLLDACGLTGIETIRGGGYVFNAKLASGNVADSRQRQKNA